MGNILSANVTIKGVRGLLWHKFGPDAMPLTPQEKTGVPGHDPEEWRRTVLVTRDGQLYLEPSYIFSCLREGAKYTKKGRATLQAPLSATLQVTDDRILIDRWFDGFPNGHLFDVKTAAPPEEDPDLPVYLYICGVRNPTTKARNVRYRVAASPGWSATFGLVWDKTLVNRGQMEAISIDAGRLVGLSNGRAIGYGRFSVESFEISE